MLEHAFVMIDVEFYQHESILVWKYVLYVSNRISCQSYEGWQCFLICYAYGHLLLIQTIDPEFSFASTIG